MYKLDKGIYLEDKNVLLEWGQRLDKLITENNIEVIKEVDRLFINWGMHKILNGLEVNLSTNYFGTPNFLISKEFTIISAWAYGDKEAKDFFHKVSNHLVTILGNPEKDEDLKDDNELVWTWYTDHADFVLNLFKNDQYKCCLTIDQNI